MTRQQPGQPGLQVDFESIAECRHVHCRDQRERVHAAVCLVEVRCFKDYSHMIMVTKRQFIGAGEFKAKCLALLDEIASTGKILIVTKRGKPIAQILPFKEPPSLAGSILKEKDIISPIDVDWDAAR